MLCFFKDTSSIYRQTNKCIKLHVSFTFHNAKADKGKTIVIISKGVLQEKIETFIQANDMLQLARDPTDLYQKHLLQTIQKCTSIVRR
jgi:adenylylsulfate kinase-like enzyme